MTSNLERVLTAVSQKITPSEKERRKVVSLAEDLLQRVLVEVRKAKVQAKVRVEGSVAKDTWLSGEPDIDIFMQLPTTMPREAFGTTCLRIAKEATKGSKQVERFAEHPYLEAFVNSTRVNIVPCYQTQPSEWLSATDRTPYHTDFVKPKLNEALKREIRLLKRFMKGVGVYGAEIKIGGFSGYLCELLVLQYGTCLSVLKAAADWRKPSIIDYARYYTGRENEVVKIFEDPLVVIDPVDKGRNVASPVRPERLIELITSSRQFLKQPSEAFFFTQPTKSLSAKQLIANMKMRGTAVVFVKIGRVKTVPDVLWGQLYKTRRSLRKMLVANDFHLVNDAVWSDEKSLNVLLFEVEDRLLPVSKKHFGPPIEKRIECERFLTKYLVSPVTVSGPRLEDERWVVEVKRKHTDIVRLFKENLKHGGRQVGVADLISKKLAASVQILINEEIIRTYLANSDFARFLTEYFRGKPNWLS